MEPFIWYFLVPNGPSAQSCAVSGSSAVIGNSSLRPEALRHHLSMILPFSAINLLKTPYQEQLQLPASSDTS